MTDTLRTRLVVAIGLCLAPTFAEWAVAQESKRTQGSYSEWQSEFDRAYRPLQVDSRSSETATRLARLPGVPDIPLPQQLGRQSLERPEANGNPDGHSNDFIPLNEPAAIIQAADRPQDSATITYPENDDAFWWESIVANSLDDRPADEVYVEKLIHLALLNSPRILAISQTPLIQETEIGEAAAEFDPELFVKTQFDDRVDPVGNDLTTGGLPFLEDNIWYSDAGVRRKLYSGASVELAQRLGFQNSNSNFFDPQDQGTATLSLNFSQPLLRGRGKFVNRSQIIIAELGQGVAWDRMANVLQEELVAVVEAYWSLYYNRSVLLQKHRNVQRGEAILNKLEARAGLDSLPSQISRARAAVQSRRTEMANAIRDVRNAETELRRLTGSPEVFQAVGSQMIPVETPVKSLVNEDIQSMITLAMEKRPEVRQAMKRAKIASVKKNVSKNDLLPELTMIFNTYVSALEGDTQIMEAWSKQFTGSTPGYAVGLEFSYPLRNRAAQERYTRQQLLLNQIRNEIDIAVQDVIADTKVSWRQVVSAHETTKAARESIVAARTDLEQNQVRWESFALVEGDLAEGQNPTTLLDQLLDAQQRLTNAELTYSQSLLEFKNAEIELKRATGTLFDYQQITFCTTPSPDGPSMQIQAGEIKQR